MLKFLLCTFLYPVIECLSKRHKNGERAQLWWWWRADLCLTHTVKHWLRLLPSLPHSHPLARPLTHHEDPRAGSTSLLSVSRSTAPFCVRRRSASRRVSRCCAHVRMHCFLFCSVFSSLVRFVFVARCLSAGPLTSRKCRPTFPLVFLSLLFSEGFHTWELHNDEPNHVARPAGASPGEGRR